MSGGIDGTVGTVGQTFMDDDYMYRCIADNTVAGANWKRVALSSY
jgi:hypothetical protein